MSGAPSFAAPVGMRAAPVPPFGQLSLAGAGWRLSSSGASPVDVPAIVPNDIADDLERAGVLPDLWFGVNSQ